MEILVNIGDRKVEGPTTDVITCSITTHFFDSSVLSGFFHIISSRKVWKEWGEEAASFRNLSLGG